jgi:hypothetical protein
MDIGFFAKGSWQEKKEKMLFTGRKKKPLPWRGEVGFWSDVPVFRALRSRLTLQFYQDWL